MWNMDYGLKKSTAPRYENEIIPTRLFAFSLKLILKFHNNKDDPI